MRRPDLAGRVRRIERAATPAGGWQVWWPCEDEGDDRRDDLVRNIATGEVATTADVRGRSGRHLVVEYADDAERAAR